jgi:hypothetical protein
MSKLEAQALPKDDKMKSKRIVSVTYPDQI